jgi:hypothetical protein
MLHFGKGRVIRLAPSLVGLIFLALSFYGAVAQEVMTKDVDPACFQNLLAQKDEFERKHPGIIIEPDFRVCQFERIATPEERKAIEEHQRRLERLGRYNSLVKNYKDYGGRCFFATRYYKYLHVFASSEDDAQAFLATLERETGYEDGINVVHHVTEAQCVVFSFLRAAQKAVERPVLPVDPVGEYLQLERRTYQRGEPVKGVVRHESYIGTPQYLLLVTDDGSVKVITPVPTKWATQTFEIESSLIDRPGSYLLVWMSVGVPADMSKPRILPVIKGDEKASELFPKFSATIGTAIVLLGPESFEVE